MSTESHIQDDEEIPNSVMLGTGPYSTLSTKVELRDHPNKIVDKGNKKS